MGAKVVYKAHVMRVGGRVDTLRPAGGAQGWLLSGDVEVAVRDTLVRPDSQDIIKVVITEERVVGEYNGPAANKAQGNGTTH